MATNCNTPLAFRVTGTGAFAAIYATPLGASVELTADIANGGSIELRVDALAASILLPAGATVAFNNIDLNRIQIKGNGYVLIVTGQR